MNLSTAIKYSEHIVSWLAPYCVGPPLVAGSIRRARPECADVDIVCIPKIESASDLLGVPDSQVNHLYQFIAAYCAVPSNGAKIMSGSPNGLQLIVRLKKCQLDLWYASANVAGAAGTFATRLLCRTGSKEHNIWLASRAKRRGVKWQPYEGIITGGYWLSAKKPGNLDQYLPCEGGLLSTINFPAEADLYGYLGLPFIEPAHRELPYLLKTFGE